MRYLIFLLFLSLPFACTQLGTAQPDQASAPLPEAPPLDTAHAVAVADTPPPAPAPEPEFSIEYIMGKFDPAQHPDFVAVGKQYADQEGYFLRKETYENFVKMHDAAQADGVTLTIISATRNFNKQKSIWEAKWSGDRKIENGTNAAIKVSAHINPVQGAKRGRKFNVCCIRRCRTIPAMRYGGAISAARAACSVLN